MRIPERVARRLEKYYRERKGKSVYFYPLAVYYFNNGQYDKAYEILLDGIQKFPRYALALSKIGEILYNQGSYESALAYLETAVNIQKSCVSALKLLSSCYEELGKFDKALEVYERLVGLGNEDSKGKLVEIAAKVKPKEEELEELIGDLGDKEEIPKIELEETESGSESLENEDEEDRATVTLAKLYEKQGYIKDAIDTYKKILDEEPDNAEAKEALDRLLNKIGTVEGVDNESD